MTAWAILAEEDRPGWEFEPLRRVGPLTFGMTFDQVPNPMSDGLQLGASQGDWRTGTGWAAFVVGHRPGSAVYGTAVELYFAGRIGLACVAVNARCGPQVILDGMRLTGRAPSRTQKELLDHAERHRLEVRYSQHADPSVARLGLVLRAQRAGDVVLSRPVMVAPAWADSCGDSSEGHIPQQEWRTF